MPLVETETPSEIDTAPAVEPSDVENSDDRAVISDRITRYGAYDRLEG